MRIAIVKPDWGIRGGFETVVDRVDHDLRAAGHTVERVDVAVADLTRVPFGVRVDDGVWARSPEWFSHLAMLDRFRSLDLRDADVVLSTQPPSYAVDHDRHLSLFYHHARAFYDLEEVWIAAGRAPRVLHTTASAMLREAERPDLDRVSHFLAGSPRVVERLQQFQGPDVPWSVYDAPVPVVLDVDTTTYGEVLAVGRHEFTKRTELVVQALAIAGVPGTIVGDGGRLPFVRDLASRIANGAVAPHELTDEDLWLDLGTLDGIPGIDDVDGVRLPGRLADAELGALYRSALCVVAPAYDEDYGLTVLEAMAHARPVIVCNDGGGLTALVEDGVNGFVVKPTGAAIAEAIERLANDRELARTMGAAGLETVGTRTAERARAQLFEALDRVATGGSR